MFSCRFEKNVATRGRGHIRGRRGRHVSGRRTLVLLAALAGLALPSELRGQGISLGLLAGANVSDQAGEDRRSYGTTNDLFGFIGGGLARLDLSGRFALEGNALYVMKGGEQNAEKVPAGEKPDQLRLNYLELPLLLRFRLLTGGSVRPELFAGPAISIEVSCRFDAFPEGESMAQDCGDAGISTRASDLGVTFGGALDIRAGSGSVVLDIRGNVSLRSIDDSTADLDVRNRFISGMVAYRFAL